MIHSSRFIVILDTNVIYPIIIRDLLFWFAHYELFIPKWSNHIFDEWIAVMQRKGVSSREAGIRVQKANMAFPDALVKNYEDLINCVELPDEKDRHVLAAAIKCNAHFIVSNNIKDFPDFVLNRFGIKIKTADEFLSGIIDLDQVTALDAFKEMVSFKKNPSLDEYEVLYNLRKVGLLATADALHKLL